MTADRAGSAASEPALSRRAALRGVGVTVVGAVAGYLVARNSGAARPASPTAAANSYGSLYGPGSGNGGRLLARLTELRPGSGVVLADQNVVVTLASDSSVHGFSATCTHQGCTVSAVHDGVITCPCHGSRFDGRTGAVITGPALRALPSVPVVVRNGAVYTQ